jgi:hypothetical protein
MTLTRQMIFWVLTFVVGVLVLYVLREILLPFVAGMALAYLLDPLANRSWSAWASTALPQRSSSSARCCSCSSHSS